MTKKIFFTYPYFEAGVPVNRLHFLCINNRS